MKNPKANIAAATYFVFFLPWLMKEKDSFVAYHQKQATVLAIAGLVGQGIVGVAGWWFTFLGLWALWPSVLFIAIWALRIFLAYELFNGVRVVFANQMQPLPWIGKYVSGL